MLIYMGSRAWIGARFVFEELLSMREAVDLCPSHKIKEAEDIHPSEIKKGALNRQMKSFSLLPIFKCNTTTLVFHISSVIYYRPHYPKS